jgi:hypothetical protein
LITKDQAEIIIILFCIHVDCTIVIQSSEWLFTYIKNVTDEYISSYIPSFYDSVPLSFFWESHCSPCNLLFWNYHWFPQIVTGWSSLDNWHCYPHVYMFLPVLITKQSDGNYWLIFTRSQAIFTDL